MVKNNIITIFLQCDPNDINIYIYICINTTKIIANNNLNNLMIIAIFFLLLHFNFSV